MPLGGVFRHEPAVGEKQLVQTIKMLCTWREVTMPALETEIVCCSIASWIDVRSCTSHKNTTAKRISHSKGRQLPHLLPWWRKPQMDMNNQHAMWSVRTCSFILSNSSIKHTPWSASTNAPPSKVHSRVTGSWENNNCKVIIKKNANIRASLGLKKVSTDTTADSSNKWL